MVSSLADERYISLTTFKRDGTPVSTPVWVASDDRRRLLVWTGANTWKVKRLRDNPRVLVAPSNFKGNERGERLAATAHIVGDGELASIALRRKYGWQKRALDIQHRLVRLARRRPPVRSATIEIVDASQPQPPSRPATPDGP